MAESVRLELLQYPNICTPFQYLVMSDDIDAPAPVDLSHLSGKQQFIEPDISR